MKSVTWMGYMSNESAVRDLVGNLLADPYDTKPFLLIKDLCVFEGDTVIKTEDGNIIVQHGK